MPGLVIKVALRLPGVTGEFSLPEIIIQSRYFIPIRIIVKLGGPAIKK